jgi:uncharacterized HhH-GPD family protein
VADVELVAVKELEPFDFRWPKSIEWFEHGWSFDARIADARFSGRHGIGARDVYGRMRVHTVTWIAGKVQVEGVEADDYPSSQALLSRLRRPGRANAQTWDQVSAGYDGFEIVEHRREIDAPYSPQCLAVKIREDDLASWALHAWLRSQLSRKPAASKPTAVKVLRPPQLPPAPSPDAKAVAEALLAHGAALAAQLKSEDSKFTPDPAANALIRNDPFAFLLAVISDMGIRAERAWALPYLLRQRLGYLSPAELTADPGAVHSAVQQEPKLHRFVNTVPAWLVEAAQIVLSRYGGDAGALWSDDPTAIELRQRLEAFPGIGQKKAAMAVEILARDLGKPLKDMSGSDIAYDVHVRRVFLRTGLVERDDVDRMVAVARALNPDRPGALDLPAWDIGRRWCRPANPDCLACPLNHACPRLIDKASSVRGV